VRARVFEFLRFLTNRDATSAQEQLANAADWPPAALEAALEAFLTEHQRLRLDPEARNARHSYFEPIPETRLWRLQQMLLDPEEHNDWVAEFTIDLETSRATESPQLTLLRITPFQTPR
jgi:hypothetical protein